MNRLLLSKNDEIYVISKHELSRVEKDLSSVKEDLVKSKGELSSAKSELARLKQVDRWIDR